MLGRALTDSERAWAGANPAAWFNVCRSVTLTGKVELEQLRQAVDQLPRRLPELGFRLEAAGRRPRFVPSDAAIEVRAVRLTAPGEPFATIEEAMGEPVGLQGEPLLRVELLLPPASEDREQTRLLLTSHHAIVDRNSVLNLIGALVETLRGADAVGPATPRRPKSGSLPFLQSCSFLLKQLGARIGSTSVAQDRHRASNQSRTGIALCRFDRTRTAEIVAACRQREITVTGLIAASAARAYDGLCGEGTRPLTYGMACDLNRGGRIAGLGSNVGLLPERLARPLPGSNIDLAKAISARTAEAIEADDDRKSARMFARTAPLLGRLSRRRPLRLGAFTVTNLGKLELPPEDSVYGVAETFGVVTNDRIFYDVAIHANTVAERLVIALTSSALRSAAFRTFEQLLLRNLNETLDLAPAEPHQETDAERPA